MVHAGLVHYDEHQIHSLAAQLQTPTSTSDGDGSGSAPAISSPAACDPFAVATAESHRNFHHGGNYRDALRLAHDLVRNCFIRCCHNFIQDLRRGINPLGDVGLIVFVGGPTRADQHGAKAPYQETSQPYGKNVSHGFHPLPCSLTGTQLFLAKQSYPCVTVRSIQQRQ